MARYSIDLQDDKGNSYWPKAAPESVTEFTVPSARENIKSGETHKVVFGKIAKYLSSIGGAAYVALANNCTTTAAGFALDARQGKVLMDKFNQLNRDLGGCQFGITADGQPGYKKAGADTVYPFKSTPTLLQTWDNIMASNTITHSYTAPNDMSLIVSVMAVTGNNTAASTILYVGPTVSISVGTTLRNKKAGGYNTNLKCAGIGTHAVCLAELKKGDVLTITIKPYEPQFQTGYDISLFKL